MVTDRRGGEVQVMSSRLAWAPRQQLANSVARRVSFDAHMHRIAHRRATLRRRTDLSFAGGSEDRDPAGKMKDLLLAVAVVTRQLLRHIFDDLAAHGRGKFFAS